MSKKKQYVCGCPESFGSGAAVYKLPTLTPSWYLDGTLPGMARDVFMSAIGTACKRWESVCGIDFSEAQNVLAATLRITTANLGRSGILADQQLPYQGMTQLRMRVNTVIQWTISDGSGNAVDLVRVLTHELGHFLACQHFDTAPPPELMEPTYNPNIISPQATEARLVAGWYGPPAQPPIPPSNTMQWIDGRSYLVTPVFPST